MVELPTGINLCLEIHSFFHLACVLPATTRGTFSGGACGWQGFVWSGHLTCIMCSIPTTLGHNTAWQICTGQSWLPQWTPWYLVICTVTLSVETMILQTCQFKNQWACNHSVSSHWSDDNWGRGKMAIILQITFFNCTFSKNKLQYCDQNFTEVGSWGYWCQ